MKCRARIVTRASTSGFYAIKVRTSDGEDFYSGVTFDNYSSAVTVEEAINQAYASEGRLLAADEEDGLL